jgi:D-xylose transport system substrate-binding protein
LATKRFMVTAGVVAGGLLLAACGSSSKTTTPTTSSPSATTAAPTSTSAPPAALTPASFTSDFSAIAGLSSLAAQGKGKIAVLLPDTASSTRYTQFDEPYLKKAFQAAGLSSNSYSIVNASGSDQSQLTDAEQAITNGASVILLDSLDSGVGASIEQKAKAAGVKVIDYDRLDLKGTESYYVSFDNVKVGQLQGQGLVSCISAWGIKNPQVLEMDGASTDNNATLFAQGYNSVLSPLYSAHTLTKVGESSIANWGANGEGQTFFQQQFTAHTNINAVLTANDNLAGQVITVLKAGRVPPKKVPTTGQDASTTGLQNILAGYQCMTVYKPIYQEAQASVALAIYLRAGQTPPSALINGQSNDQTSALVPSILLTPTSVTAANMASTVIKDGFATASTLCAGSFAATCKAAGINS